MKKVLATIIALLPLMSWGQSFILSPYGYLNAEDQATPYIVIPMEGTKAELFQKAKTALTAIYKSPKDVLSYNEPDIITINGYTNSVYEKRMGVTANWGIHYTIQILFKDGKIRINAPDAFEGEPLGKNRVNLYLKPGKAGFMESSYYVFDKDGHVKKDKIKKQVEDYFNGIISDLVTKMKNGAASVDEDW
jgi:uncharacterized protein YxeA